jgi:hypothetical protein
VLYRIILSNILSFCRNSVIILLKIRPSSCPTFCYLQANILPFTSQHSAVATLIILLSCCLIFCHTHFQYSAVLMSSILPSSCSIPCFPHFQCSAVLLSSIMSSSFPNTASLMSSVLDPHCFGDTDPVKNLNANLDPDPDERKC